jgi:ankyrin repeat protein
VVPLLIAVVLMLQSTQKIVPDNQAMPLHVLHTGLQKKAGVSPLPLEPGQHVSFARIKDWSKAKITLRRIAGAWIHSPQYTLEVHGDGTVLFNGEYLVAFVGKHRGVVPPQNVLELVALLKQADLYSVRYRHPMPVGEGSRVYVSVLVNGPGTQSLAVTAMVLHRLPTGEQLEDAIDRLAGSERWIKGNAETLAALEAEHWDFKSHEAANALARLAAFGSPQAAHDLIHAGVPLDGNVHHDGDDDDENGCCPPLEYASSHGDLKLIQALLNAGAAANTEIMWRALYDSAYGGYLDAFHFLLANGASVKAHDLGGRTLLMAAASSGVPAMLKEILKSDQNVNAITDIPFVPCGPEDLASVGIGACLSQPETDGRTALMEAVDRGDYEIPREGLDRTEVVRILLAAGADVNARDTKGNTALLLCHRNIKLAELLLQAGAHPNVRNSDSETPLQRAGSDEMKRLLIKHGAMQGVKTSR